jgi:aquaporin NIP
MVTATQSSSLSLDWLRKIGAEMIGTFMLVFAGCGAIVVNAETGALGHLGVSLTFGLVVMVMVQATGHISGAHLNPAVTLAFALRGRFSWSEVPGYVIGQCVSATLAAFLLSLIFATPEVGATLPRDSMFSAMALEMVATAALMFVIMSVATDERAQGIMAAPAIGGTVALGALFAGPISGASLNPARSLGPALIAGDLSPFWIYLSGPVMGAAIGALIYDWIRGHSF